MPHEPSKARRAAARLLCALLAVALATGCSTLRSVSPGPGGPPRGLRPGDAVRILKHDGRVLEAYVVTVAADGLVVEPDRRSGSGVATSAAELVAIRSSEIERVDRYEFAPVKTAVAVGAAAAAAACVAFIAFVGGAWGRGGGSKSRATAAPASAGR